MIKFLIRIAIILVIGIIAYNYFQGTTQEKQEAKTFVKEFGKEMKDLGGLIGGLIISEKEKFDEGKYDKALSNMRSTIDDLKEKAKNTDDAELKRKVNDFEKTSDKLLQKWEENKPETKSERQAFKEDIKRIIQEADEVIRH